MFTQSTEPSEGKKVVFARRYALPGEPVSFFDQRCVDVGLGNTSFRFIHAGQANSGSVICVRMIFISAPQTGQVMTGCFFCLPYSIRSGLTRSTT